MHNKGFSIERIKDVIREHFGHSQWNCSGS